MPGRLLLTLRKPGAEHFVARRRFGIRALRRTLGRLLAQAGHGVVPRAAGEAGLDHRPLGKSRAGEGLGDGRTRVELGLGGRLLKERGTAQGMGELHTITEDRDDAAEFRGRTERVHAQIDPCECVLEHGPGHPRGSRDRDGATDVALQRLRPFPEGVCKFHADGNRVGKGDQPIELLVRKLRAGGEHRGGVASGRSPELREDRCVEQLADPSDQIVRRLLEGERLQRVGGEGRLREGERRAVEVVPPGEHQDRRDTELGIEHGTGDRAGQLLLR